MQCFCCLNIKPTLTCEQNLRPNYCLCILKDIIRHVQDKPLLIFDYVPCSYFNSNVASYAYRVCVKESPTYGYCPNSSSHAGKEVNVKHVLQS